MPYIALLIGGKKVIKINKPSQSAMLKALPKGELLQCIIIL